MKENKKIHPNLDLSIIGKKFSKLTVIEYSHSVRIPITRADTCWICKCECGNTKIAKRKSLISKGTKSCGCLYYQSKNKTLSDYPNLVGKRFGRLLVVERIGVKNHHIIWKCLCDCGNTTKCASGTLNYGSQKSCGCSKITSQLIDLVGKKFGSYTVIERIYYKDYKNRTRGKWKCECDCGTIKFFSISHLKKWKLNCCQNCRNYYGKNNGNYNPNITDKERFSERKSDPNWKIWKKSVYKRDNYTCQITGRKGPICAHHLESWHCNEKLRYILSNGITILQSIHRYFHSVYGIKNNSKQQFEEFIKNLIPEQIKEFK